MIAASGSGPSDQISFDAMSILRRRWHAALTPGAELPRYEDVMLGSLGRLADDSFVMGRSSDGEYRILYTGESIALRIEAERGKEIAQLPSDCRAAIRETLDLSLQKKLPVSAVTHRVRNGMVETLELLALPLANRWGAPLVGCHARSNGATYSLVDAIFRSATQGILILTPIRNTADDADFQIVALNRAACKMLQRSEQSLQWRRVSCLELEGVSPRTILTRLRSTLETGKTEQFEAEIRFPERVAHFYLSIASIGELIAVTFSDVTEVKERESSFRVLFDDNPAPMYVYDPVTLDVIWANMAAVGHYGYSSERFLNLNVRQICADGGWRSTTGPKQSDCSGVFDCEMQHRKADGSKIDVLAYLRPISFHGRAAELVTIMDITERRRAESRITHMAHHDALTGLANRAQFNALLEESFNAIMEHGDELALFCIDLDRFKIINDTLGHQFGDRLLQLVANRIQEVVNGQGLAARLGGDEFVVIRKGRFDAQEQALLADRLLANLSAPYEIEGHVLIVGASMGLARAPQDGTDPQMLLRKADLALYHAKEKGRGTFCAFEIGMDHAIEARRQLELDLRLAFSRGEFELHYQPLFDVQNCSICSFEALLRWPRRENGFVPPGEFIPVAEETELIIPLGEWVLRKACADAAKWPEHIRVSVNLSPVQFKSKNLVTAIMSALASSRLSPQRLELEITESVLLKENEENIATLHRLRGLGVRIVMDDFGTGYSSLSYLRSFPFDKIKIDKSFISELASRSDCVAIVRAVIGLATSLGIETTAEGVETEKQLDCLREEGCTEAQGFLLSRPQPISAVDGLLLRAVPARAGQVA